jgi:hypothetical protein
MKTEEVSEKDIEGLVSRLQEAIESDIGMYLESWTELKLLNIREIIS